MASRVNVKFVVLLTAFFVVSAGGVVGAAYFVLSKSGDNYATMAREAYEAGDFQRAAEMYGRAVGHDRTRVDWLEAWRDALLRTVPDTTADYTKAYNEQYLGILTQLATLQPNDAEAQRVLLDALYSRTWWLFRSAEAWESMIDQANRAIDRLGANAEGVDALLRYRGLAGVEQMRQFDPPESVRERTRADLRAALAANPEDAEVASALARWHMLEWRRLRTARQVEQASLMQEQVVTQIDSLDRRFPQDPLAQVTVHELRLERALIASNTYAAQRAALRGMRGSEDALVSVIDAAPTERLDGPLVSRFVRLLRSLRPEDSDAAIVRVCRRILEDRPDDPQILLVLVGSLQRAEQYEDAIETAARVADMPDLPVSLDGLLLRQLRIRAVASQAESALGLWEDAATTAERTERMEQIRAHRARLVDLVAGGESAAIVLMLDARVALSEGRFQAALAALEQYRRSSDAAEDAEVLRLTTRALLGENQLGAARQQVEALLELEPDNTQALLLAAEIDRRLLEPQRAVDRLRRAIELEPENVAFQQALAAAQAASGVRPNDDPIIAGIMEINERLESGAITRAQAAEQIARIADEHPDDVRPVIAQIENLVQQRDLDAARRLADDAVERFPNSGAIATMQRRLNADDPVAYAEAMIEESGGTELEKLLRLRALYREAGRADDAEAAMARAVEIDPDNRLVLEVQMADAVDDGRLDDAARIAQRAAATNADEVNGLIFQALLQQGRGDDAGAVETLDRVLETLPYSSRAWQMLGQSQLRLGQAAEAVESLSRSFEARPDDVRAAQSLVAALLELQRTSDALVIARRSAELNPGSARAWTLRLELEEAAGDAEFVIRERRRILAADPDALDNRIALIRTLTTAGRYDEAAELAASTRERFGDSLALAMREAMLLRAQGQVDAGRERLVRFIESAGDGRASVEAYLTLSEYLTSAGRADEAVAALRAARPAQSPEGMEVDRALGDLLFNLGRAEEAVEPYRAVVNAGGDDADSVRKRLAETLVRLERWDDAEAVITELGDDAGDDAEALLLRAEIALGKGDNRRAQELLNEAVRVAPNNPLPFIRRASANLDDPDRANEVMDDLEQALRLQPNNIVARRLRATVFARRGQVAGAAAELRLAVDAHPRNDELRASLIGYLIQNGSWDQAITIAEQGVQVSARAPGWLRAAADTYMIAAGSPANARNANRYRASAANLLREALERNADQDTAIRLLSVVMSLEPPAAQEALTLLESLDDEARAQPRFLLIGARAKSAAGRQPEALADVRTALSLLETPGEVRLWFNEARRIFSTPLEAAQFIAGLTPPDGLATIFGVQLTYLESSDISQRATLIARLNDLEAGADDQTTLVDLYRLRSRLEYQAGDFEAAADTLRSGRELLPDDSEFNNNLAFVLAKHLGDLEGATAPAEKAAELNPNDPNVLDTLGWIYLKTGRLAQAQALLQQAVDQARTPAVSVPANIHLAEIYLLNEEFATCRRYLDRAAEYLKLAPELAPEYQAELDSLIQRLDQAEG
jgi:tetratricopeptide (TPR) repeat protein